MEQMNQDLYSYMHDIFGAEVIEIFDMKYEKENLDHTGPEETEKKE